LGLFVLCQLTVDLWRRQSLKTSVSKRKVGARNGLGKP